MMVRNVKGCRIFCLALLLIYQCHSSPIHIDKQNEVNEDATEGGVAKDWQIAEGILVSVALVICAVVTTVVCLCCNLRRKQSTAATHHNGFPVSGLSPESGVGSGGSGSVATEFTIFPPIGGQELVDQRAADQDVKFEPLPDIHPRRRTNSKTPSNNRKPRPATFSNVVSKGLSFQDWFEDPYSNFPRTQLQYVRELGSGWFGQVVEGEAFSIVPKQRNVKVVVKILTEGANTTDQMYFLHEVKPFRDLNHPNILKLLGKCLEIDPFLIILEYCAFKDLKSYLVRHRTEAESLFEQNLLLRMACDVAAGLNHVHRHGYILTDLAARNCVVSSELVVKIGDYGNSIEMYKEDYYCAGGVAVPVRWCAPETLRCTETIMETREVTREANVWSFGVLLWEILEFGKLPYVELSDDELIQKVVIDKTETLKRPLTPCNHVDRLYQVIQLCHQNPGNRPSMDQVESMLQYLYSHPPSDGNVTAEFDARWNQLRPRPSLSITSGMPAALPPHEILNGADVGIGNSPAGSSSTSPYPGGPPDTQSWRDMSGSPHPSLNYDSDFSRPAISPSLQNLRGSLEDLRTADNSEALPQGESEGSRSLYRGLSTVSAESIPSDSLGAASWLKSNLDAVGSRSSDNSKEVSPFTREMQEVIRKLDEDLERECPSSSFEPEPLSAEDAATSTRAEYSLPSDDHQEPSSLCVSEVDYDSLPTNVALEGPGQRLYSRTSSDENGDDEEDLSWRKTVESSNEEPGKITRMIREKSQSVQDFLKLTVIDSESGSDSDGAPTQIQGVLDGSSRSPEEEEDQRPSSDQCPCDSGTPGDSVVVATEADSQRDTQTDSACHAGCGPLPSVTAAALPVVSSGASDVPPVFPGAAVQDECDAVGEGLVDDRQRGAACPMQTLLLAGDGRLPSIVVEDDPPASPPFPDPSLDAPSAYCPPRSDLNFRFVFRDWFDEVLMDDVQQEQDSSAPAAQDDSNDACSCLSPQPLTSWRRTSTPHEDGHAHRLVDDDTIREAADGDMPTNSSGSNPASNLMKLYNELETDVFLADESSVAVSASLSAESGSDLPSQSPSDHDAVLVPGECEGRSEVYLTALETMVVSPWAKNDCVMSSSDLFVTVPETPPVGHLPLSDGEGNQSEVRRSDTITDVSLSKTLVPEAPEILLGLESGPLGVQCEMDSSAAITDVNLSKTVVPETPEILLALESSPLEGQESSPLGDEESEVLCRASRATMDNAPIVNPLALLSSAEVMFPSERPVLDASNEMADSQLFSYCPPLTMSDLMVSGERSPWSSEDSLPVVLGADGTPEDTSSSLEVEDDSPGPKTENEESGRVGGVVALREEREEDAVSVDEGFDQSDGNGEFRTTGDEASIALDGASEDSFDSSSSSSSSPVSDTPEVATSARYPDYSPSRISSVGGSGVASRNDDVGGGGDQSSSSEDCFILVDLETNKAILVDRPDSDVLLCSRSPSAEHQSIPPQSTSSEDIAVAPESVSKMADDTLESGTITSECATCTPSFDSDDDLDAKQYIADAFEESEDRSSRQDTLEEGTDPARSAFRSMDDSDSEVTDDAEETSSSSFELVAHEEPQPIPTPSVPNVVQTCSVPVALPLRQDTTTSAAAATESARAPFPPTLVLNDGMTATRLVSPEDVEMILDSKNDILQFEASAELLVLMEASAKLEKMSGDAGDEGIVLQPKTEVGDDTVEVSSPASVAGQDDERTEEGSGQPPAMKDEDEDGSWTVGCIPPTSSPTNEAAVTGLGLEAPPSPAWETTSTDMLSSPSSCQSPSSTSSTSGEFDCSKDFKYEAFKIVDTGESRSGQELEEDTEDDDDDDGDYGDDEGDGEEDGDGVTTQEIEFKASTWDKDATPSRSVLKSPDKHYLGEGKKTVSFKLQKRSVIYEYPREEEEEEEDEYQEDGEQEMGYYTIEPQRPLWGRHFYDPMQAFASVDDWDLEDGIIQVEDLEELEEDDSETSSHQHQQRHAGLAAGHGELYTLSGITDPDDVTLDYSGGADWTNGGNLEFANAFDFSTFLDQYNNPQFCNQLDASGQQHQQQMGECWPNHIFDLENYSFGNNYPFEFDEATMMNMPSWYAAASQGQFMDGGREEDYNEEMMDNGHVGAHRVQEREGHMSRMGDYRDQLAAWEDEEEEVNGQEEQDEEGDSAESAESSDQVIAMETDSTDDNLDEGGGSARVDKIPNGVLDSLRESPPSSLTICNNRSQQKVDMVTPVFPAPPHTNGVRSPLDTSGAPNADWKTSATRDPVSSGNNTIANLVGPQLESAA